MIQYIYHIADLHIFDRNYINLSNAFTQLIRDFNTFQFKALSILVIAGDVFEHKASITPDDILFFHSLMDLLEKNEIRTIIIPGNHDCNLFRYRKNTISSILVHTNYNNIICVDETQIFPMDNIDFYVFSPSDNESLKIPDRIHENERLRISIIHEMVNGATFDSNPDKVDGQRFNAEWLSQTFDITLLGDIHKPQFLTDKKNVAYSGSLVQKHIGEGLNHGYILWDIGSKTGLFKTLPMKEIYLKLTPCGFGTLEVDKNTLDQTSNVPEETKSKDFILPTFTNFDNTASTIRSLCVEYKDCSSNWIKQFITKVEAKYGRTIDKLVNRNEYLEFKDGRVPGAVADLRKPDVQIKSIDNILQKENFEYTQEIIDLHNKYIQKISPHGFNKWTLNYITFSNILCYNDNNHIDFRQLIGHGLVSLLGNNKIGKSAILDILGYILYNRTIRGSKKNILNNQSKRGYIKCSFSIQNDEYSIEQIFKFHTVKKNDVSCALYKNGSVIEGGDLNNTYNTMNKLIGTYDDFIQLTCATQNRSYLIDLKPKEKLEFFCKFLEIDVLNSIEKEVQIELRDIKARMKQITEISLDTQGLDKLKLKLVNEEEKLAEIFEKTIHAKESIKKIKRRRDALLLNYNASSTLESTSIQELENIYTEMKKFLESHEKLNTTESIKAILESRNKLTAKIRKNILEQNIEKEYLRSLNNVQKPDKIILDDPLNGIDIRTLYKSLNSKSQIILNSLSKDDVMQLYKKIRESTNELDLTLYFERLIHGQNLIRDDLRIKLGYNLSLEPILLSDDEMLANLYKKFNNDDIPEVSLDLINHEMDKLVADLTKVNTLSEKIKHCDITTIEKYQFSNMTEQDIKQSIRKMENYEAINIYLTEGPLIKYNTNCECCLENKKILDITTLGSTLDINLLNEYKKEICRYEQNRIFAYNSLIRQQINDYNDYKIILKKFRMHILTEEIAKIDMQLEIYNMNISIIKDYEYYENQDLRNYIDTLENNKKIYDQSIQYNSKVAKQEKLNELEKDMNILNSKFDKLELILKFKKYQVEINEISKNISIIKANQTIQADMKIINDKEQSMLKSQEELNSIYLRQIAIVEHIKSEIKNSEYIINKNAENAKLFKIYTRYLKLLNGKAGLPSMLLNNACAILTRECNKILNDITDFQIKFTFDAGIDIDTITKNIPISAEMGSGFQKFVIDLCIRIVLTQISKISRPNILMIDEGFGCLDPHNFKEIQKCIVQLKHNYDYILIISHIQELKSSCSKYIKITRVGDFSNILFGELTTEEKRIHGIDTDKKIRTAARNMQDGVPIDREAIKAAKLAKKENAKLLKQSIIDEKILNENKVELVISNIRELVYYCSICAKDVSTRTKAEKHILSKSHLAKFKI